MAEAVVGIERLAHATDLPLPAYATPGAAGVDLMAAEAVTLAPGDHAAVATGLRLEMPPGIEGQVRPRSGLALKYAVTVLNAPGTIDSDYRGEVRVLLINLGRETLVIERGMRVAQLVFAEVAAVRWDERPVTETGTARGSGGFGSTGTGADLSTGSNKGQRC